MKKSDNYNEEDWYFLNAGHLYLPRKDSNGNDMEKEYLKLGLTLDQAIEPEFVCLNPPKSWKAYMDYEQFNKPDFVRGYHSVLVDEDDNVILRIWTKRMGMRMLEYICLEIMKNTDHKKRRKKKCTN